jgi:large subunit ribosomal protein L13
MAIATVKERRAKVSTYFPKSNAVNRKWHVIDAKGQVLGRLATQVATFLRGKDRPTFTPYLDEGDFVVIVNAELVKLTGNKLDQKVAFSHSLYPGGLKLIPYSRIMAEHPERAIIRAVGGMLCKNKFRARMLTRLKVYKGESHPHSAQQPQPMKVAA